MAEDKNDYFKKRLLSMRDTIHSLESVRKGNSDVVELDQARNGRLSRMDALQVQAMAKAGRERAALELQRIETALDRIESGTFGNCVACAEPIADARLDANPAALLCLACAEAREQN